MPGEAATEDPLEVSPRPDQRTDPSQPLVQGDWTRAIGELFRHKEPPRWVMLLGGSRILLIDRKTFANGRWLAFDLDDAFGRSGTDTFDQIATFLARETLAPDGESTDLIHDTLEEESHKLSHRVTENLQATVREAIDLLDNEWVRDRGQAQIDREYLVAMVESSPDAIISKDLNGIITSWNGGAAKLFDYTAEEMVGTPIRQLIPEHRQHEENCILEKLRRGERIEQLETQWQTRDGCLIDVSITVWPTRNAQGEIIGASKIARDITVLKQRERQISRLSRLYAALSQINQAIVKTSNRDELLPRVCQALVDDGGFCIAWIGWHRTDTDGLRPVAVYGDDGSLLPSLLAAEDYPYPTSDLSVSLAVIALRSHQPYICNDALNDPATGAWRGAIAHGKFRASAHFPIRLDEAMVGVLNVYAAQPNIFHDKEIALLEEAASDLSFALNAFARDAARHQAEQALRDEKRFTDMMIESMPGILYFYNTEGHFLRWNQNFERVSGYAADEITHMHPLDFFAGDDRTRLEQRIEQVFTDGESSIEAIEADFVSKNGTTTPYFFTGQRVQFENTWCLVGVGIDVSALSAG